MHIETTPLQNSKIEKLRIALNLPKLAYVTTELGDAGYENHRRDLRRSLIEYVTQKIKSRQMGPFEDLPGALAQLVALNDLSKVPTLSYLKVSLSHSRGLGGFAVNEGPEDIGFDIELADRVKEEVINRVSKSTEVALAPDPASLWAAKESSFKALYQSQNQPKVLAEIEISDWQLQSSDIRTFGFVARGPNGNLLEGRGAILTDQRFKLGFSAFRP